MNAALRPMTLGEILDRTFSIYRERFWIFALISATSALGMLAVRVANEFWWRIPAKGGMPLLGVDVELILFSLLFFHINLLFAFLTFPAITRLTAEINLGRDCSLTTALKEIIKRWPANLGLALFEWVLVLVAPEIVLVTISATTGWLEERAGIDTSAAGSIWVPEMAITYSLGVAAFFWLTSLYAFSWSGRRIESLSAWRSLGRSRRLTRGARWKILVARLAPTMFWWVLTIAAGTATRLILVAMNSAGLRYPVILHTYQAGVFVSIWAISTMVGPIFPIAATLFYYDQRIRKEGFDIEYLMQSAGMTAVETVPAGGDAAAPSLPAAPVSGGTETAQELRT